MLKMPKTWNQIQTTFGNGWESDSNHTLTCEIINLRRALIYLNKNNLSLQKSKWYPGITCTALATQVYIVPFILSVQENNVTNNNITWICTPSLSFQLHGVITSPVNPPGSYIRIVLLAFHNAHVWTITITFMLMDNNVKDPRSI